MPGWTGDYDWTGTIPFAELPQAKNPASGQFVSANNKIVPERYPYFLSRDWDLPNRAERITEMLAATPLQSPAASAAIQADTLSIAARRLVPLMTRIVPGSEPGNEPASALAREAIERLRAWDFRMDPDKVEPLLFTAWLREFAHDVLFGHLGDVAADYWDLKPRVMEVVLTAHPEWCAERKRPLPSLPRIAPTLPSPASGGGFGRGRGRISVGAESCDALLATALDAALAELGRAYGPEMLQWQWGRAHIAEFANPVFGRIALLRDWVHVGVPTPGGFDTVNRGSTTIRDDAHPYEQRFGAGLRIITDLASPADSRMIAVPGQSGNPLSPHFSDLLQRWSQFDWLVPGRAAPISTLTLAPR
jgi:penicillin amidase